MLLTTQATRFLFFTGKGGVGKTSLSCATALDLAGQGKKVLLVSTDPASNLREVLECELGSSPRPHPTVTGLSALNIDPEAAALAYRESVVGAYRGVLPAAALSSVEEQLSGACTTEIAAFDEFAGLLDAERIGEYEHVVFDTAPTGHTLRLLELPAAWTDFLSDNTSGTSCLGPLSGLKDRQHLYEQARVVLGDAEQTTILLVARPDRGALEEAARSSEELRQLGIANQTLLLNGLLTGETFGDPLAEAIQRAEGEALGDLPETLRSLGQQRFSLVSYPVTGVKNLRRFARQASGPVALVSNDAEGPTGRHLTLETLVHELEQRGRGVIMTMGKGGVGKSSVAAALASYLAEKGHPVRFVSTDPAGKAAVHLLAASAQMSFAHIDPQEATARYVADVHANVDAHLDEEGRRLLDEDLRSPCTEEIAVFRAFADAVEGGEGAFVVVDTAPTGHTLLLLDATQAYHRQVDRTAMDVPESVKALLPRLRDPGYTAILLVTLPEATPVHEAKALQVDLLRAGITPYGWVVNRSLTPVAVKHPVLAGKKRLEPDLLEEVSSATERVALVAWRC